MAPATVRVSQPVKQKGRPVAGRPLTNFINGNNDADSTTALRLQRLNIACGLDGRRADLVAFLVWGEAHHG